jgi:hypothetical protein
VHTVVYNSLFSNVLLSLIRVLRFFAKNIFLFAISKVTGGYLRNGVVIYVRSSVCVSVGLLLLYGCIGGAWACDIHTVPIGVLSIQNLLISISVPYLNQVGKQIRPSVYS